MAPTVHYFMTIFFLFTIVNGASIKSGIKGINIIPEKCRELLTNGDRSKRRNYCTETTDLYSEKIQKEIEERIGENLFGISVPVRRNNSTPLTKDDCTTVDAQQNCCTKSGWETPTYIILNGEQAKVVQTNKFVQQVKTVECAEERTKCFSNMGFLQLFDYTTECKTDYAYQKVYVYYIDQKTFTWAHIRTPVSCSCVISRSPSQGYSLYDSPQTIENYDMFDMEDSISSNI